MISEHGRRENRLHYAVKGLAELKKLETFRKTNPSEPYVDVLNAIVAKAGVVQFKLCEWDKEVVKEVVTGDVKYVTLSELKSRMDHIERIQLIFANPDNQQELDIVKGLKHIYADVANARNERLGEEEKKD